ncbi:unnamed protein product [Absidia cylindrospora]
MELIKEQTILVKPERTPLTQFCTQISGITPEMVASANSLKDAIDTLDKTIRTDILDKQLDFCFVTHGGWALRIQLSREARDKQLELPPYLAQPCMFDLKQEIQRWQVHHPDVHLHSTGIRELCDTFQVPLIRKDGEENDDNASTTTSNIDIPATTIGIVRYLTKFEHNDVFVHPIDTSADLQQFKKEESKVVHLAGLPYEVTQGELEAWFSSSGLRPATMWMMQSTDQTKPNLSGFVVFSFHDDAIRALLLNGRCLSDKVIEVSASSERVVEAAMAMLSPFPTQAKPRTVRPGDWKCPNCNFHNFASRHHCFKCNAENPVHSGTVITGAPSGAVAGANMRSAAFTHGANSLPIGNSGAVPPPPSSSATPGQPYPYPPGGGHHPPGTNYSPPSNQGDWMCPNTSCSFHNYASRTQCMKCNTYRPSGPGSVAPPHPPPPGHHAGYNPPPHHHHYAPRPHHTPSFRPGDWYCPNPPCGFQNFASRMSCYRCHTPNPNPGPQQNYGGPPNAGAGGPHGSYGYDNGPSGGAPYGGNGHGSSYGNLPPGNTMAPGTGGHGFRVGDWYCPSCNSHNFASRFQCLKCHTAKPYNPSQPTPPPYAGANAGGFRGPPPMMKNGDWVCRNSGCGFHNFAKRTFCGKCHAPNPEPSSYGTAEY